MHDRYTHTNRKPLWHRACALLCAAALACSLVPASAFAAEEQTGTTSLGVSLKYLQLSVDAPAQIVFRAADGTGLNVDDRTYWDSDTLQANVSFVNRSERGVYLAGATMKQTTTDNVGKLFNGPGGTVGSEDHPFLTLDNGGSRATIAQTNATDTVKPMIFGTSDKIADHLGFSIGQAPEGGEATKEFQMRLDMAAAPLKANDALEAYLDDNPEDFCSFVWTFALSPSFYLAINDAPQSEALEPWAGQEYTLEQVRADSKALGSGAAAEGSDTYTRYYAMATSMAPEGDYTCYAAYAGEQYRLRLIGLNQDYAAESFGSSSASYVKGDRVGLTFQFLNACEMSTVSDSDSVTNGDGGWGGDTARYLRERLQAGGDIYGKIGIDLQNAIIPVTKCYTPGPAIVSGDAYISSNKVCSISQKMFIASRCEVIAAGPDGYTYKRLDSLQKREGAGPIVANETPGRENDGESYLFYQNKFGSDTYSYVDWMGHNDRWLKKYFGASSNSACVFSTDSVSAADTTSITWVFRTLWSNRGVGPWYGVFGDGVFDCTNDSNKALNGIGPLATVGVVPVFCI